jgi:hypothetical protein
MPEPMPQERFAALMAAAGLDKLPPAEVEDLRLAQAKLQSMLDMLRDPPPGLAAEPAFTFAAKPGA